MIKPKMHVVRQLHALSGDFALHKRTLEPMKALVYGLHRHDVDRSAALLKSTRTDTITHNVAGFRSPKTKIYLTDVRDIEVRFSIQWFHS